MKHSERPIKLWELIKGQWHTYDDEYVTSSLWSCEATTVVDIAELRRLAGKIPAICQPCARRLGLEW